MQTAIQTLRANPTVTTVLSIAIALQSFFWFETRGIRPELEIVSAPPSATGVQAVSLGDEQWFFRWLALGLQNSGDTYGRFTSLRYYDYARLYQWFTLLDKLDPKSDVIVSMASYYYSQTQNEPDTRYLANYIYEHAVRDVPHKWWWLIQGMYLATHKLNDMDFALKMTSPLVNPDVPIWAQQLAAVVREKRGEMEDAYRIMESIAKNADEIPERDLKYMTYFVQERLKRIDDLPHGKSQVNSVLLKKPGKGAPAAASQSPVKR